MIQEPQYDIERNDYNKSELCTGDESDQWQSKRGFTCCAASRALCCMAAGKAGRKTKACIALMIVLIIAAAVAVGVVEAGGSSSPAANPASPNSTVAPTGSFKPTSSPTPTPSTASPTRIHIESLEATMTGRLAFKDKAPGFVRLAVKLDGQSKSTVEYNFNSGLKTNAQFLILIGSGNESCPDMTVGGAQNMYQFAIKSNSNSDLKGTLEEKIFVTGDGKSTLLNKPIALMNDQNNVIFCGKLDSASP